MCLVSQNKHKGGGRCDVLCFSPNSRPSISCTTTVACQASVPRRKRQSLFDPFSLVCQVAVLYRVAFLLARSMRTTADLVDQLLNSSEKRVACLLLLIADFDKPGEPEKKSRRYPRRCWLERSELPVRG